MRSLKKSSENDISSSDSELVHKKETYYPGVLYLKNSSGRSLLILHGSLRELQ